jgi:hypothetical protein
MDYQNWFRHNLNDLEMLYRIFNVRSYREREIGFEEFCKFVWRNSIK